MPPRPPTEVMHAEVEESDDDYDDEMGQSDTDNDFTGQVADSARERAMTSNRNNIFDLK